MKPIFRAVKSHIPRTLKEAISGSLLAYRRWTSPLRVLPDFIIIGAQKSGTGSLYRYLLQHPDVYPALRKEIRYFDRNYMRGVNWYRTYFPLRLQKWYAQKIRRRDFLTGEATPEYLFLPNVAPRVKKALPDVKLIVLLRDPAMRAYSHYQHKVRHNVERLPFAEAIEAEEGRLAGEREHMLQDKAYVSSPLRHYSYLARGVYVDQLAEWFAIIPESQILVLRSEDLFQDTQATFGSVLSFLGLNPFELVSPRNYSSGGYASVEPDLLKPVQEYFEPYNRRLEEYLGRKFHWN